MTKTVTYRPPSDQPIRARRVGFDWDTTPLQWIPGDPQTTHTINVLHLLLPAGESWFVDVFREVLPLVTDDALRADVRGFMGQETIHGRSHDHVLDHLAAQGIDTRPFTRRVEWLLFRFLAADPFGHKLGGWLHRQWLLFRVAIVSALEQYTAVLGIWVLDAVALDRAGADPTMVDLLRWHGAEEVEHRSVAYDLYQHVSGSYLRRQFALLNTTVVLATLWVWGVRFLMKADPGVSKRASWRAFFHAGKIGRLPTFASLAGAFFRYLQPWHHPSREGSTLRALAYLATSPAAQAAARRQPTD
ncbi:MAG: metal-dependent hydrolase [Acidimicrobiales bacterium]